MKKIIVMCITLVIFTTCTYTSKKSNLESENTLKIHRPLEPQNLFLSNVVDSISIIKLETTNESLIGRISSIKFYQDEIFISDNLTEQLFVFDKEGNFLRSLHAIGQGPGEYTKLSDFAVDGNYIYVLDFSGRSILVYDLEFNFEKAIKITCPAINIEVLNSEIWLYNAYGQTSGDDFALTQIDNSNGEQHYLKRKQHGNYDAQDITVWVDGNVFSRSNGSIFYCERYGNYLFDLKKDYSTFMWQIDFGKYTIPESTNAFLHGNVFYGNSFPYIVKEFFAVSDKYIIIRFYDSNGRPCYAFQDKESKTLDEGFVINDIVLGFNRFTPDFGQNNTLVEVVSALLILDEEFNGIVDLFPSLKNISEDDNYVLIKYHLKQ